MTKPHMHYMPPAAAKHAIRLEAQKEDPTLEGGALDMEVKRRYKIYLDKCVNHFKAARLRYY